ncbi:MAG: hypothetical protein IPH07_37695 [Deltaproteobacteria bacterium]|nr:hypothetical protein [Deltaproteobacteria bacterium]MBK8235928.1 hypothetical protein [Deltaproteobacteria bacterium]MBK8713561.1 hypothetical protein [Deltaproteobacteria bacterium]MBP7289694.1 hypothetical protein [Nannocystaceae bacterium]
MPFQPGLDADGEARVEEFLEMFETRISAMLAAAAKVEIVARAPGKSIVEASAVVRDVMESALFEDLRIAQTLGLVAVVEIGTAVGAGG